MIRVSAAVCWFAFGVISHGASAQVSGPAPTVGVGVSAAVAEGDPMPLSLNAANALLLERNRELRAAQRRVDGARADVVVAGQRPNPVLSVGASTPFQPRSGRASPPRASEPGSNS